MNRGRVAIGVAALAVAAIGVGAYAYRDGREESLPRTPLPSVLPDKVLSIGVQDDQLPVADPATIELRLDTIKNTGVRVTRVDVLWNLVAPTRPANGADHNDPAYVWERYDTVIDGLNQRGIAVLINTYRTPEWANGGKSFEWAPTDLDAYGDFMRALATRYDGASKDRAGTTHARVRMFEPWNEPNIPLFVQPQWTDTPEGPKPASPRIYAEMLDRSYGQIHAAQPDAVVIGPCLGPTGKDKPPDGAVGMLTFIDELDRLDPKMDALSQHIYPASGPTQPTTAIPSYGTIPRIVDELDRLAPGAPIIISEMGYTTARTPYRATSVTEEQQAEYLPQAFQALAANPRIRLAIWFNLQDNPDWPAGLMRLEGRTKKPSWQVFVDHPKTLPSGDGAP